MLPNANLDIDQAGLDFITKHEGIVLRRYNDVAGLPTIGVGHLITKAELATYPEGATITHAQAMQLLRQDVQKCVKAIRENVKVPLNQNQFNALVSFAFNCGTGVITNSGVGRALAAGNYADVPARLLEWSKARVNGTLQVVKGLYDRRKTEADLFARDPNAPAPVAPPAPKSLSTLEVQQLLVKLGYSLGKGGADGVSGPATKAAIVAFQTKAGLDADGVVGPATTHALLEAAKKVS